MSYSKSIARLEQTLLAPWCLLNRSGISSRTVAYMLNDKLVYNKSLFITIGSVSIAILSPVCHYLKLSLQIMQSLFL